MENLSGTLRGACRPKQRRKRGSQVWQLRVAQATFTSHVRPPLEGTSTTRRPALWPSWLVSCQRPEVFHEIFSDRFRTGNRMPDPKTVFDNAGIVLAAVFDAETDAEVTQNSYAGRSRGRGGDRCPASTA